MWKTRGGSRPLAAQVTDFSLPPEPAFAIQIALREAQRPKPHLPRWKWYASFMPLEKDSADDGVSRGTINVVLANQNGIIALTDSMVTAGRKQLREPAQKLFKLDDRTVCTIAGFLSSDG